MKKIVAILIVLILAPLTSSAQNFCEGNFDYDDDQDGSDAFTFKTDFGRSSFDNPCPPDGPAPVPKTGQTTEYTPGDDGYFEKGIEWPNPRFRDNGDGTVTDNLTGLIWLKNANCFGVRNWWEAIADCNELGNGQCGLTDGSGPESWRLPNLFELESLRDMRYWGPALPNTAGTGQWTFGDPFINLVTSGGYWSSTTFAFVTDNSWIVDLHDGQPLFYPKSYTYHALPVRHGH